LVPTAAIRLASVLRVIRWRSQRCIRASDLVHKAQIRNPKSENSLPAVVGIAKVYKVGALIAGSARLLRARTGF
jgi:hypothetical protein